MYNTYTVVVNTHLSVFCFFFFCFLLLLFFLCFVFFRPCVCVCIFYISMKPGFHSLCFDSARLFFWGDYCLYLVTGFRYVLFQQNKATRNICQLTVYIHTWLSFLIFCTCVSVYVYVCILMYIYFNICIFWCYFNMIFLLLTRLLCII